MAIDTFPIILENTFMLSSKVKHFIFKCDLTPALRYLPGQFMTIHFEHDHKILRRSYSIANVPTQNNCIELAATYIEEGPGTTLLFNLKPGEMIQASAPYGRLILKEETPKRYILVATSTGITPYRAMFAELIQRLETNPELRVDILQGVQKRDEILYIDEFIALTEQYPKVSFHACLSREDKSTLLPYEHPGYVQHRFDDLNLNPNEDHVYLCGNPAMIDDAFNRLKEKNFPIQHIIREKYISR
jgi:ferredoxin-NADP reductase